MTQTEQEFFERCMYLEGKKFELEDIIEDMLDYILKTNITLEELTELQRIAYKDRIDYPELNMNLKTAMEII